MERNICFLLALILCFSLGNSEPMPSLGLLGVKDRPRDCADIRASGADETGTYIIYLRETRPVMVYCDMDTDGGGWTVFQHRRDGTQNFYRGWADYAKGFGDVSKEFWLGNEIISTLTAGRAYTLRIDLGDFNGQKRFALYSDFQLGPSCDKYKLISVGKYSGTAGDSLSQHVGRSFSTMDNDNDLIEGSCANAYKGAWWYSACHASNLNGEYLKGVHKTYADGVEWFHWTGHYYSLQFTEMKIRPSD